MKSLALILTLLLGFVPLSAWAQSGSIDELTASYRTALQEKSLDKLNAITYTVGQSDSDKNQAASLQQMLFSNNQKNIGALSLEPLPPDFQSVYVVNGKKIEPTYPPIGLIKVQYSGAGNGPDSSTQPYSIIGGHYFLVTSKSTDLGWKGPPDKGLSLMVTGSPQDKVQISLEWNASGVDQKKVFNTASAAVPGQYVKSAIVTSTNPDATLVILEGNNQVFCSPPLKDKKDIEYKKN